MEENPQAKEFGMKSYTGQDTHDKTEGGNSLFRAARKTFIILHLLQPDSLYLSFH